jgi:hypothetical protein
LVEGTPQVRFRQTLAKLAVGRQVVVGLGWQGV